MMLPDIIRSSHRELLLTEYNFMLNVGDCFCFFKLMSDSQGNRFFVFFFKGTTPLSESMVRIGSRAQMNRFLIKGCQA